MHGPPEQAAAQLISRLQAAGVFDAQGNLTETVPRHSDLADMIREILEKLENIEEQLRKILEKDPEPCPSWRTSAGAPRRGCA